MTSGADLAKAETAVADARFAAAVAPLGAVRLRPEIRLGDLPAPGRLAPYSHAVSVAVVQGGDRPESATGRLIVLHDPNGVESWEGTFRIVIFLTCEMDPEIARDPLLPEVAWSWMDECLRNSGTSFTALGGTITATSSTRYGDIAGPERTDDLEIRASWTAIGDDLTASLIAFGEVMAIAAGLPPEGVIAIGKLGPPNVR